jgi:hypothetical protein
MQLKSWLVGSVILLSVRAAGAAPNEEAKRAFSAGVILLKDPDGAKYEDALAQFNKAYRLSGSWKVLGNIGLCSLKLERDGEAISAYEKYLAEGGKEIESDERTQVERDIVALKAQVVRVQVDLPAGASRIVDERTSAQGARIVNEYAVTASHSELGLHPGHHVLTARLAGAEAKWDVNLDPATAVSHRFEAGETSTSLATAPQSDHGESAGKGSTRTIGWIIGGVGVVGLGVGAVFGLKTFSNKSDSDPYCNGTSCTQPGLDLRSDAKSFATISDIAFAAGLVGVGVGTYLVFFNSSSGDKSGATWKIGPRFAAGASSLELRGEW